MNAWAATVALRWTTVLALWVVAVSIALLGDHRNRHRHVAVVTLPEAITFAGGRRGYGGIP
jgi:hypothetical protein